MCVLRGLVTFFFFKQKTAYEMRISDWSSDVCSSDLYAQRHEIIRFQRLAGLMKDVTWKLATTPLPCIDDPVRPFFRDVWDHVQRAEFRLTGQLGRASCRERVCQYG